MRESPHTVNVRDGDADVIRVLFKHVNLEHTSFLNKVCCFICIWIGVCHQFQQDLLTRVERETLSTQAIKLQEPYLVKKNYVLKVVGSWETFRKTTSTYFCRNLPIWLLLHMGHWV